MTLESFYTDDGLMGANTVSEAIHLRREMQKLFEMGCFKLRKWKATKRDVLASIPEDLKDHRRKQEIHNQDEYTKVLGVEWNVVSDCFRPVISTSEINEEPLTKQVLVSNIAHLF